MDGRASGAFTCSARRCRSSAAARSSAARCRACSHAPARPASPAQQIQEARSPLLMRLPECALPAPIDERMYRARQAVARTCHLEAYLLQRAGRSLLFAQLARFLLPLPLQHLCHRRARRRITALDAYRGVGSRAGHFLPYLHCYYSLLRLFLLLAASALLSGAGTGSSGTSFHPTKPAPARAFAPAPAASSAPAAAPPPPDLSRRTAIQAQAPAPEPAPRWTTP
jgi:hypothetical protein